MIVMNCECKKPILQEGTRVCGKCNKYINRIKHMTLQFEGNPKDYSFNTTPSYDKTMEFELSKQEDKNRKKVFKALETIYGTVGKYSYIFTPTGIGTAITIKSELAGVEIDITDYDSW